MKFTVAVLALLCLSIGANASNKALGVKLNKTAKGVHVDLPDITVPKVSLPQVNLAVNVKKPSFNTTTIDLPDFTIPTLPKPNIDLSGLTALLGSHNSTSLAGLLKKNQVDLSALQSAVQSALQLKSNLTSEAAGALQTLATAVYQAKYNVTSKIADIALEALSKKPTISVPQLDLSPLTAQLNKTHIDLSALQGLFSKNTSAAHQIDVAALIEALVSAKAAATPTINLPSVDGKALLASLQAAKDNLNETLHEKFDIHKYVDVAGLQKSLAELAATVELPKIDVESIKKAIENHNNETAKDIQSLVASLTAQTKKNATADLVGLLNALKEHKAINFTLPTLQLPKMPTVNIAAVTETLQTLKNVTASIAADELKSAAILAWLKDAGFYQIKDAVSGTATGKAGSATSSKPAKGSKGADGSKAADSSVTINLGKN